MLDGLDVGFSHCIKKGKPTKWETLCDFHIYLREVRIYNVKIEGELAVHTLCCRIIFNKIFKMNFRRGNVKYWKNLNMSTGSIFEYTHAPK